MMYFAPWKIALIALACLASVIFSIPSFFPAATVATWPNWLPKRQVSLGLDLRGGAHLLLEVDTSVVLRERLEAIVEGARTELRQARIGYTNLGVSGSNSVTLRLRDATQTEQARQLLIKLALPVQSTAGIGFGAAQTDMEVNATPDGQIRMTLSEAALLERARNAVTQSIEIVRRRIDQTGVSEPTIQRQGADRILVQLPGVDDPERIKRLLGTTAKLTFRMVDVGADPNAPAPPGSEILEGDGSQGRAERYVVKRKVEVAGDNLVDAQAGYDQRGGQPVVNFRFDTIGGKRFAEITQQAVGQPFAIVLDNKVLSAPVIREPILGGSGQISGNFTVAGANDLAVLLRAGALPAPLKVVEERTVGPDLGEDSIRAGLISIAVAAGLVVVYMVLAYGLFGLFADVALLVNLVMTLAAMSLLQATLTLPGIAGLLLTLGMSVDANVLINERIREETKLGKSPMAAMSAGFSRAFSTIFDANVTTLIKMALLYALGSGTVKGFAVTISIGILTSMFTATVLVRLMMVTWLRQRRPTLLPV
ncbi:MAG: protein translocase subunit SecD [Ferrovibrio sp.]|uniref:protein translocase subunit SecD n=1 Tax=Ferrovibrio sp. TaxID=1917215 RepID=UPI00261EE5E8|nr:protein translocase subunit SecD [Ferrovibrio sp.]MCW0236479.1 protein translocase subunit SecD [Ferrovibrio sp.]